MHESDDASSRRASSRPARAGARRLRGSGARRLAVTLLLLALIAPAAVAQDAGLERRLEESRDEAEGARERLARLGERIDDSEVRLGESTRALNEAEERLRELQGLLVAATEEYAEARSQAREAAEHLEQVTARLERSQERLALQRKTLGDRVAAAYKYGGVSVTEVLLESEDITDFLNSATYVGSVMDRDRFLVQQIRELVGEVIERRAEADAAREEADEEQRVADAAKEQLEQATDSHQQLTDQVRERRNQRAKQVEDLQASRKQVRGHLNGIEAESNELEDRLAELARQQREEARRRAAEAAAAAEAAQSSAPSTSGAPSPSGGWTWPASCGRVTSRYGMRWGRMHQGVDIACGYGSQIRAARGGTVYSTYCGSGYGNCVLLDHGGGFVTLYGHQSSIAVAQGQSVNAGQVVGFEGSTGNSTGSHLHFEVRVNGSPRDPCSYIGC